MRARRERPPGEAGQVTIYDVARRAKVSIATVSFVVNRPEKVSPATRERVLAVIDETGYVPRLRAVEQARAGFGRIAVVAPFSSYPSFARRLNGVLAELEGTRTQVLVYDHEDVAGSSSPLLSALPVRGHVDGVIIMGIPVEAEAAERLTSRLPTLLVDWRQEGLASVGSDDVLAGRLVGEHLRASGYPRVAFVGEVEAPTLAGSPVIARERGLREAVGADRVLEVMVPRGADAGQRAVERLLADGVPRVSAVFAHRDLLAIGIVAELRRRGIVVPGDVAVVGCDDDPYAAASGLSTVRLPFEESGRQAVRSLKALADGADAAAVQETLPIELVLRDTTLPPGGCLSPR